MMLLFTRMFCLREQLIATTTESMRCTWALIFIRLIGLKFQVMVTSDIEVPSDSLGGDRMCS